jgi:ABC-type multidrug transport system fused ATPase/permease subunit
MQKGRVLLDGADIKTLNVKWLRSQISKSPHRGP